MGTYGPNFPIIETKGLLLNIIKVNSHIKSDEEWQQYNMTAEALILNELADEAATIGKMQCARPAQDIINDGHAHKFAYEIALRLAFIEAEIWRRTPEPRKKGANPEQMIEENVNKVKRKFQKAHESTEGMHGHHLILTDRGHRCVHCT